jgi:glycosyltransferase involved in cell wall biosynthesis
MLAQVLSEQMAKSLRIAVWYNLPTGGARRALHDHVKGLVARGHEVECFRPPIPSPEWMAMPCPEQEVPLRQAGNETTYLGRVVRHLNRSTLLIGGMEMHSKAVVNRIHAGGFDIVFANTCSQFYAPFIGRYLEIPKFLYLQEPNRFLYESLPHLPWRGAPAGSSWRRKLRATFDLFALKRQANEELVNAQSFDRILVNSYFSREAVARAYGLDSHVCYLGIDTDHFALSSASRKSFVLGIGAIVGSKRVDLAIRSIAATPGTKPKLIWVGNLADEGYLAELKKLAASLEVDVEFRCLVSEKELLRLMQASACVLYTPRLEPFGYVPLEAVACGTPVVTVAEGGLRETMAPGYGCVADPTPSAIGEKVAWVLENQEQALREATEARPSLVEKWNLSAGIDRLERHLFEVSSRP